MVRIQILLRQRSTLVGLHDWVAIEARLKHLDLGGDSSTFDALDRMLALQLDGQGPGMSRQPSPATADAASARRPGAPP
jgi:hypothetical protein